MSLTLPPSVPRYPVAIRLDKDAYRGTDELRVAVENITEKTVWIKPFIQIDRSQGDGTWASVYKLRVLSKCPKLPDDKPACVQIEPGASIMLPKWDWNTGGDDQCPPRRPGHRAFKGVHRLVADWCDGKAPPRGQARVKLTTWE